MRIVVETEEKNKEITIPTAFGEITIEAERVSIVKADSTPIYSVFFTKNHEYIASIPPSIVKINDPINFANLFDAKNYGELSPHLKKTVIPALAKAAGYDDVDRFVDEKLIKIRVQDYTGRDHPEEIFSDAVIVEGCIADRCITSAWKKIDTPTAPTLARFLIEKGFTISGEKEFIAETLDELKKLPFEDRDRIIEYATRYIKHIIKKNLEEAGLL